MKQVNFLLVVCILAAFVAAVIPTPVAAQEESRVFIQFRGNNGRAVAMERLQKQGGRVHFQFDELNAVSVSLPAQALDAMRADPDVLAIEMDEPRYLTGQVTPYGVETTEARAIWDANQDGVVDAGAPTGQGITVCIIDSGIQANHEDFQNVNIIGGYPAGWDTDNYGHGTHVAGTIAAMNNTLGVVGVTPGGVSLYIVKVFGDTGTWTYSSTLVDAAYKCRDAGAKVISMSLEGANFSSIENYVFNQLYNDYGILSVAAAGNSGGTAYSYPASYDAVISVGAVDQNNAVASFSRTNDKVELTAPGVNIYSTFKNTYANMSGTSMATPHVTAAAALVWSANPSWTNAQIRQALTGSALDLGTAGRDNAYGFGVIQAQKALQLLGWSAGAPVTPPPANVAPTAAFTFNCTGLTCAFDASSSTDPDGSLTAYNWTFGNGATATGATANVTYAAAGDYTVTLTVTDDQGATAQVSQTATARAADTTAPVITVVKAVKSGLYIIFTWTTNEPSTTVVIANNVTTSNATLVTAHSISIKGKKGTTYTYYVQSADAAGNTAVAGPYSIKY